MPASQIVCPNCSAINRIPNDKLTEKPKCGKCKNALFNGHPTELNDSSFERFINKTDLPVVVDFWADWCGPCKMMAPAFVQASQKLEPFYKLAKVNTETAQQIAAKYQIRSIPTLMIFKNSQIVAQQAGAMQTNQLIQWVKENS